MAGQLRAALIDQAVSVAASVGLFAAVYVALRPELRRSAAVAIVGGISRLAGVERRAWLSSAPAEFARRRRDLLIAQEWAPTGDPVP